MHLVVFVVMRSMVQALSAVHWCWMLPWEDEIVDVLHVAVVLPLVLVRLVVEDVG